MIERIKFVQRFIHDEAFSGYLLFIAAILAIIWANISIESYQHFWHAEIALKVFEVDVKISLQHLINDALMPIFFLLIGLEIKREFLLGELKGKKAVFPVVAALGGSIIPALIYIAFNPTGIATNGFGIPMATDIAFVLGALALISKRVPLSLKTFLVSLAVADDLFAIVVIALFYTDSINAYAITTAFMMITVLFVLSRSGVRNLLIYLGIGGVLWLAVFNSGIHATLAGVVLAIFIPINSKTDTEVFSQKVKSLAEDFSLIENRGILLTPGHLDVLSNISKHLSDVQNPLTKLEENIHGVSAYFIIPLFALANAGVEINLNTFTPDGVFWGKFFILFYFIFDICFYLFFLF